MPEQVVDVFGYALYLAQAGGRHDQAKPLRGFGCADVLEAVEDWRGNTYRAVYTVRYAARIFVCMSSKRSPRRAIATPKPDLDLIKERLKAATARAKELEDE